MKTKLRTEEVVIKESFANLQRNIESVGGKLYLTNQRLIFEPHKLNIQARMAEIAISSVQFTRNCRTRFLGLIPTFNNSLSVYTKEGKEYRFVLNHREKWEEMIGDRIR